MQSNPSLPDAGGPEQTGPTAGALHITRYEFNETVTQPRQRSRPVRLTVLWILSGVVLPWVFSMSIGWFFSRMLTVTSFLFWVQYVATIFAPPVYVAAWWLALRKPLSQSAVFVPILVASAPSFIGLIWLTAQQAYYGVSGSVFGLGVPWALMVIAMELSLGLSVLAVIWLCGRMFRVRLVARGEKVYAKPLRIYDIMGASVIVAFCCGLDRWLPALGANFGGFGRGLLVNGILSGLVFTLLWTGVSIIWALRSRRVAIFAAAIGFLASVLLESGRNALIYRSLGVEQNLQVEVPGLVTFLGGAALTIALQIAGIVVVIWITERHGYQLRIVAREPRNSSNTIDSRHFSEATST